MNVATINASFYKNVLLLTKVVTPSDNFIKCFREDMFMKPNSAGFIHVSHYLLTIYDPEGFKALIQWPLNYKDTEIKYRNSVKDYLNNIAKENADVGFPHVLSSHLVHAGNTKFIIIMWKLSIVTLRRYLRRNCKQNILYCPKPGIGKDIAKQYLDNKIFKARLNTQDLRKNLENLKNTVANYLQTEKGKIFQMKEEILEEELCLKNLIFKAPINDKQVKKQLININNTEIVQSWKESLKNMCKHIEKKNHLLHYIEHTIDNIIQIRTNESNSIVDGKQLKAIIKQISEIAHDTEDEMSHLYVNDKLVISGLFSLFANSIEKLYNYIKIEGLKDFSLCRPQIEASYDDIKLASNVLQNVILNTKNDTIEINNMLNAKKQIDFYNVDKRSMLNNVLIPSPQIRITANYTDEISQAQQQLQITPVHGTYKALFSRHERKLNTETPTKSHKKNVSVTRINFDESLSLPGDSKSRSRSTLFTVKSNNKIIEKSKYARLFMPSSRLNQKGDCSTMSLLALKGNSSTMGSISSLNLDTSQTYQHLRKNMSTPEKCKSKTPNIPLNRTDEDKVPNQGTTIKSNQSDFDVVTEMEIKFHQSVLYDSKNSELAKSLNLQVNQNSVKSHANNCVISIESNINDIPSKEKETTEVDENRLMTKDEKGRRLSISDLVTRYQHLVKNKDSLRKSTDCLINNERDE
ncbi:putative leucine-rich repeat-containing protein DDB_G0290503 [Prorops nasuta]|uniref:putative leucine-rich repeat-containing protein DDB_G0290503 n=1 Tax=Prorops nasuta TaxID=863751 RepID=UPI0034CFE2C6